MEIHYQTKKLEKYLDPSVLIPHLGAAQAKSYIKIYNLLKASNTFADYLKTGHGKPELLYGNLQGCYSIRLNSNYRMIVRPETKSLNIVDLQKCESIEMKGVIDYHGSKYTWKTP